MSAAPRRVVFGENDHVLALLQDLIDPTVSNKRERLSSFVAPEALCEVDLDDLTSGLATMPGLDVRHVAEVARASRLEPTVLVVRRSGVPGGVIEQCPDLRLVQRLGQRTDGIDLSMAAEHEVAVSCLTRPSLISVAEHVLMLVLAMSRRLAECDQAVREARRDPRSTVDADGSCWNWVGIDGIRPVRGRTLGIVGMGEVGMLVADLALALGMRVNYADNSRDPLGDVRHVSLDELLATSDFVSLHVPAPEGSPALIDAAALRVIRPGACLINTSRGRLIDEAALIDALGKGRLAGAALDVHAVEPRPADDPLLAADNILLTPHLAAGSRTIVLDEARALFANVRAAIDGHPPIHDAVLVATEGANPHG